MNTLLAIVGTTGLGVLTMYIFDPVTGRMRRAKARDQLMRFQRRAQEAAAVTARDLKNRGVGTFAATRAKLFGETVDDVVLAERVRSRGRSRISTERWLDRVMQSLTLETKSH